MEAYDAGSAAAIYVEHYWAAWDYPSEPWVMVQYKDEPPIHVHVEVRQEVGFYGHERFVGDKQGT